MKKYKSIEIEVCTVKIDDIVTASGEYEKRQTDSPFVKLTPSGEIH